MESGVGLNYMRIKAFPFSEEVQKFIDAHDRIYVVEQNRDAQLRSLLMLELSVHSEKLVPTLTYDGLPIHAWDVVNAVNEDMAEGAAA